MLLKSHLLKIEEGMEQYLYVGLCTEQNRSGLKKPQIGKSFGGWLYCWVAGLCLAKTTMQQQGTAGRWGSALSIGNGYRGENC